MNELFLLCIAGIYTGPDVMLKQSATRRSTARHAHQQASFVMAATIRSSSYREIIPVKESHLYQGGLMVDVMHYVVIKKHAIDHAHLVVYLFESDGGRYFSAARAPEDVAFEIGDILKHDVANIWVRSDGTKLKFEGNITCSTLQEAEARFTQQIAEIG
jgi:hypothetical protein